LGFKVKLYGKGQTVFGKACGARVFKALKRDMSPHLCRPALALALCRLFAGNAALTIWAIFLTVGVRSEQLATLTTAFCTENTSTLCNSFVENSITGDNSRKKITAYNFIFRHLRARTIEQDAQTV
jgi:hypothetical protein